MTARRTWIGQDSVRPAIVFARPLRRGDIDDAMGDVEGSSRSPATEISELS